MVISHKFKFIFVKTARTAGTSIEIYLSPICDAGDSFTPFSLDELSHEPRNFRGLFNPLPELAARLLAGRHRIRPGIGETMTDFLRRRRYFHHIPAWQLKARLDNATWSGYYKFCVERDPWDKVLSGWGWYRWKYARAIELDDYLDLLEARIRSRKHGVGAFPFNLLNYTDPRDGKILVDEILDYGDLEESLGGVFKRLGIPYGGSLGVRAKNQSRGTIGRSGSSMSDAHRDRIGNLFREEIALGASRPPAGQGLYG